MPTQDGAAAPSPLDATNVHGSLDPASTRPPPLCSLITFGNAGSAERAAVSMHGAHVGDHVLSVTLQPASGTQAPGGSLHPGLAAALGGNWVGPEW